MIYDILDFNKKSTTISLEEAVDRKFIIGVFFVKKSPFLYVYDTKLKSWRTMGENNRAILCCSFSSEHFIQVLEYFSSNIGIVKTFDNFKDAFQWYIENSA